MGLLIFHRPAIAEYVRNGVGARALVRLAAGERQGGLATVQRSRHEKW